MGEVRLSAVRFKSMLENRGRSLESLRPAKRLGVDPASLYSADQVVTYVDIVALAKCLKVPWSALLPDTPEPARARIVDHRTYGNLGPDFSSAHWEAVFSAQQQLDICADLFPDFMVRLPDRLRNIQQAEDLAHELRSLVGVNFHDQLKFGNPRDACVKWIDSVSAQGIYVAERDLKKTGVRAFSLTNGQYSCIVLSTGDTYYARAYSLIHELSHIAIRREGLCDFSTQSVLERFCNQVAAEFLLPRDEFLNFIESLRSVDYMNPDSVFRELPKMSRKLSVSQAAIAVRLHEVGRITEPRYREVCRLLEQQSIAKEKGTGGGNHYTNQINRTGRALSRQVVSSLDSGRLSSAQAASLLGVRRRILGKLAARIRAGAR